MAFDRSDFAEIKADNTENVRQAKNLKMRLPPNSGKLKQNETTTNVKSFVKITLENTNMAISNETSLEVNFDSDNETSLYKDMKLAVTGMGRVRFQRHFWLRGPPLFAKWNPHHSFISVAYSLSLIKRPMSLRKALVTLW